MGRGAMTQSTDTSGIRMYPSSDWRPYRAGHWTWVEPFGWTWVGDEPWGWAPYHYGAWVHQPSGWGWCPGPSAQYWSPAVVSYCQDNSDVAWCPLAPAEVRYPPALSVGFRGGDWSAFFSIGAAAVYYPTAGHYCVARPWQNTYVNQVTYVNNVTNITNVYNSGPFVNRNTYFGGRNFVPVNAQYLGATHTSIQNFGGRSAYQPVTRANVGIFSRGRAIGAPANGGRALAGPPAVRVTRQALTPTRTFQPALRVQQQLATRAVYRAPLPANVPRAATLSGQRFTAPRMAAVSGSRLTPGRVAAGATAAGMGAAAIRAARNNAGTRIAPGAIPLAATRPGVSHAAVRVPASASSGLRTYLQQRNAGRLPSKSAPNRSVATMPRARGHNALTRTTAHPGGNPAAHTPVHTALPATRAIPAFEPCLPCQPANAARPDDRSPSHTGSQPPRGDAGTEHSHSCREDARCTTECRCTTQRTAQSLCERSSSDSVCARRASCRAHSCHRRCASVRCPPQSDGSPPGDFAAHALGDASLFRSYASGPRASDGFTPECPLSRYEQRE